MTVEGAGGLEFLPRKREPKPEPAYSSSRFVLKASRTVELASFWRAFLRPHLEKWHFDKIPAIYLTVAEQRLNREGRVMEEINPVELDRTRSIILPKDGAKFEATLNVDTSGVTFVAGWVNERWTWGDFCAAWLVTVNGDDIPVIFDQNAKVGLRKEPQFRILWDVLHDLVQKGSDLGSYFLRRRDEDGRSVIELLGMWNTLLADTDTTDLRSLYGFRLDTKGLARPRILEDQLRHLRPKAERADLLEREIKTVLDNAIQRFEATKHLSRKKEFGEIRLYLEAERDRLLGDRSQQVQERKVPPGWREIDKGVYVNENDAPHRGAFEPTA